MNSSKELFHHFPNAFSHDTCIGLSKHITHFLPGEQSSLSRAFEGAYGQTFLFQFDAIEEVKDKFSYVSQFVERAINPICNYFFLNALVLPNGSKVASHVDSSLDSLLGIHTTPVEVTILYTQVPNDINGGILQLFDKDKLIIDVQPQEGLMFSFRGDLAHSISQVTTNSLRISLVLEQYKLADFELERLPSLATRLPRSIKTNELKQKIVKFISRLTDKEKQFLSKLIT